jgi:hypothetical protein
MPDAPVSRGPEDWLADDLTETPLPKLMRMLSMSALRGEPQIRALASVTDPISSGRLQSSNSYDLRRHVCAGVVTWPNPFDLTRRSCA